MIDRTGSHTAYLILFNALDATPIGINCRLCDRSVCPQHAAPPVLRRLFVDETMRSISPFTFKDV